MRHMTIKMMVMVGRRVQAEINFYMGMTENVRCRIVALRSLCLFRCFVVRMGVRAIRPAACIRLNRRIRCEITCQILG